MGVLCLVLVQPPREVSTQLTSARLSAVADVILRWMMMLAVLLAVGYVTKSLTGFPRRIFLTWAAVTPVALIAVTLAMQELMRRFLHERIRQSQRHYRRLQPEQPGTRAALAKTVPACAWKCPDFSTIAAAIGSAWKPMPGCIGSLSDMSQYVKDNRTDVIFIALPIRHVKRVMNLLDDLRDTTASIYYVPDIFVFDLIQARSGEIHGIPVVAMCETPFYGYRGVAKRLTDIGFSALILLLLLPLLVVIAFVVKLSSPGPIIFKQRRYGLDGTRDRGLQISHHAGHRRRRADTPSLQDRQPHHPRRRGAAPLIDGRVAAADQCAAGTHEPGGSETSCGRSQ